MGIKSLSIGNFRGIAALDISGLASVNLIGGRNNSGKSSILEAVSLLSMRRDASAIPQINNVTRRMPLTGRDDLAVMFNNEELPLVVSAQLADGHANTVRVSLESSNEGEVRSNANDDGVLSSSPHWALRQHVEDAYAGSLQRQFDVSLRARDGEEGERGFPYSSEEKDDILDWTCMLMSSNSRLDNRTNQMFAKMTIALEDKEVTRVISSIYPEIFTIKLVNNQLMVKMKGHYRLLPAKVAGDGVVRIVSILCGLWSCRKGCLCVDEIDNGLHYSVLLDFWRAVLFFANRYNVQLVATTHHLDALETLAKVSAELNKHDEVAYYRLTAMDDGRNVARFSGENLDRAIKMGFEVRG